MGDKLRLDFAKIDISSDLRNEVSKTINHVKRESRNAVKPSQCILCSKEKTSFCNSHSIPRFCLKSISVDGKVLTLNSLIEMGFLSEESGVNSTGTFKLVCRECDNSFFKDYENPDYYRLNEPNQSILGQIATKNYLMEISKIREQIEVFSRMKSCCGLEDQIEHQINVRELDLSESEKNLRKAIHVGSGSARGYDLFLFERIDHVVPFAFQGMVNLISDFDGGMINNVFNYSSNYKIEPVHLCVFPCSGFSVVLGFHDSRVKRFNRFKAKLGSLELSERLLAVEKVIFAYSEEPYLSKSLPENVVQDEGLKRLAKMNSVYVNNPLMGGTGEARKIDLACREYAISNLPDAPNLFDANFAIC